MAGEVALSQALSYARDLRRAYDIARARESELEQANERLRNAYQQSLQYAVDLKKTYRRLQRSILQSLLGLANAIEAKDPYTRGHSTRVASLARKLALAMGLPRLTAETSPGRPSARPREDRGAGGHPEKGRAPSPDEWQVMRRHPLTGAQIVFPLEFFDEGAIIVRHHHERLDGTGYPDGLVGDLIPIGARIVAVADVYDALTSGRPYRGALEPALAIRMLREESGRTLDARAVVLLEAIVASGPDMDGGGGSSAADPR